MKLSFKNMNIYLYLIFAVLFLYQYADLTSSNNIGLRDANRFYVYVSLFMLAGLFFVHNFIYHSFSVDFLCASLLMISFNVFYTNYLKSMVSWTEIVHLGLSLLWLLSYVFFSKYIYRHPLSVSMIVNFLYIALIVYACAAFYASYNIRMLFGHEIAVLNLSYYVIVFLPLIWMENNNILKAVLSMLVFLVVISSFKRGALIVYCLMLATYFFVDYALMAHRFRSFVCKVIVFAILFVAAILMVNYYSDGLLFMRFAPDELAEGSGRAYQFSMAVNNIADRGLIDLLFGWGSGSSIIYTGTYSIHNEYLEFLFSFGVLGFISYILFIIALMRNCCRHYKENSKFTASYAASIVYVLIVSLYGGVYFVHSTLFLFIFWAIAKSSLTLSKAGMNAI